jgi:hypothetical protein
MAWPKLLQGGIPVRTALSARGNYTDELEVMRGRS